MEGDIVVDLGASFDRWVDFRVKLEQHKMHQFIDANFKYYHPNKIKEIDIRVSPGLLKVIEFMEYQRDLVSGLLGVPKN